MLQDQDWLILMIITATGLWFLFPWVMNRQKLKRLVALQLLKDHNLFNKELDLVGNHEHDRNSHLSRGVYYSMFDGIEIKVKTHWGNNPGKIVFDQALFDTARAVRIRQQGEIVFSRGFGMGDLFRFKYKP